MKYEKKFFCHWNEHKPEEFPPESAFKGLDVRLIITKDTVENNNNTVFIRSVFPTGAIHGKHIHHNAEEVIYINKGYGLAWQNGEWHNMGPGDIQFIPKGEVHAFKNEGEEPVEMLCTYSGCNSLESSGYEELQFCKPDYSNIIREIEILKNILIDTVSVWPIRLGMIHFEKVP